MAQQLVVVYSVACKTSKCEKGGSVWHEQWKTFVLRHIQCQQETMQCSGFQHVCDSEMHLINTTTHTQFLKITVGQLSVLSKLLAPSRSLCNYLSVTWNQHLTRKPSYRWQTRARRKPAKNCSNSTCLQRCRWQYWPIFMHLAAVASEICEIPRNSLKIQAYKVQGHPRSSILVSIESPYVTCY